ncbi:hypothetical protein GSI_05348 [Ganoderma sinense ZZ0214-1]|uniref:Uncharacterized protein n=1 Tax=Ganoderma sinense ZZ0214-1 TaxID=1077348 RepID=A0A2G8SFU2_9APHY|nr:hypothetical protein GSI_05348 [Ganoderma sinense ZZ0214-1]
MPRSGSESTSSRRHNPTQTLSNYFHITSQVWPARTNDPSNLDSSPPSSSSGSPPEVFDDLLSRTPAPSPRSRWSMRRSAGPYGHRPLHKWLPSEPKHFDGMGMLMEMFPQPNSDSGEDEKELPPIVVRDAGLVEGEKELAENDEEEEDVDEDAAEDELEPELDTDGASPHTSQSRPLSAAAAKKREKNKKKRAKARAKAKERDRTEPDPSDTLLDTPQDLLASMSRIAKLVGSLSADAREGSPDALLQRVRDALGKDGQSASPARWRSEVLQSVRRMESMLGKMEKWQAQVSPSEIEALRQETVRLEARVRAVVEQAEVVQDEDQATGGKGKESAATHAQATESPQGIGTEGNGLVEASVEQEPDGEDMDSISDSDPDSNSCPSESDTGPTEPEPEDHSPLDEKVSSPDPDIPQPTSPPTSTPVEPPDSSPETVYLGLKPHDYALHVGPHGYILPAAPAAGIRHTALHTLASKNHNVPPDPPPNPADHLTKHPWSMLEVLFLLEVTSHFPPAENGWTFIAEAYNNILITRPLQEWFGKQATTSNEEEGKMKTLLREMNAESRRLRARAGTDASGKTKAGERGKAAPFGSVEAHAEANAHVKSSATPAASPSTPLPSPSTFSNASDKDALVVTRLPFPLEPPASDVPLGPPPSQRIVPFPRRRPPLTLPCADAGAFARVMKSAAAGVRPPSAESRAAMLALYTATKTRFPVRSPWECWHRWSTPWIVPESHNPNRGENGERPTMPPMVLDYVAGNIGLPCGTWITQARLWEFAPVPGTYPDAPGVMHRVTAGYDPRPGMVSFARMAHLSAEKTWAGLGLGRKKDGMVAEDVLASRRMKLPTTLAGIWPGKLNQKPSNARPPAATPASTPAAAPVVAVPSATAPIPPANANKDPAQPASVAAVPPPSPASPSAPETPQPQPQPQARPAPLPNKGTIAQPPHPFLPLPQPHKPPPRLAPNVPEGTLGNRTRPGIRAWFQTAAVRADVLERVAQLERASEPFEHAMSQGSAPAAKAKTKAEADAERIRLWEKERERERWVPFHLREIVVSPRAVPMCLPPAAVSQA